jgi:hypothetical protein
MYSILSYAFILPILGDIYNLSQGDDVMESVKLIGQRIAASGVVLIMGAGLNNLLKKVIDRMA